MAEKTAPAVPRVVPIDLPSRGLLYEGKIPEGRTTITPMTTKDEKILMGARQQDRIEIIDSILARHLETHGVALDDLVLGDRFFALLVIRNVSYGPEYKISVKCESCGDTFPHVIRVPDDLRIRVLEPEDAQEPLKIKLPISNREVGLRHLRGIDEKAIRQYARQNRSQSLEAGDPAYLYRIARAIASLDGKNMPNPLEVLKVLDSDDFASADSMAIQQALEAHACGVDLSLSFSCPECAALVEMVMPFTAEFFRPSRLSIGTR